MSRYIDADKLIAHLKCEIKECEMGFGSRSNQKGIAYGTKLGLTSAISFAETLDTADVVPRAEMEKWRQRAGVRARDLDDLQKERDSLAREIFGEIDKLIIRRMIADNPLIDDRLIADLAELKKKYTEGDNE